MSPSLWDIESVSVWIWNCATHTQVWRLWPKRIPALIFARWFMSFYKWRGTEYPLVNVKSMHALQNNKMYFYKLDIDLLRYTNVTWASWRLKSPAVRMSFKSLLVFGRKKYQSSALLIIGHQRIQLTNAESVLTSWRLHENKSVIAPTASIRIDEQL